MPIVVAFVAILAGGLAVAVPARAGDASELSDALQAIDATRRDGDVAGAARAAAELVAKNPRSLDAHVIHQDLELALGHEKQVADEYRAAVKAPDASADAHYLVSRVLNGAPAVGELRAALKADPAHFPAACRLAIELTRSKAFAEARTLLDAAAKQQPKSAVPLNALGRVEEARGKPAEAEKLYRAALELDPGMTEARVNLGMTLVALGNSSEGLAQLKDAAARAPKDPLPQLAIGMALRCGNDEKSALDAFKKANAADGADVVTLNLLANAYLAADAPQLAEEVLKRALKVSPGSRTTNINMAHVKVKQELLDEAVKFATAATLADDTCAEAHFMLAVAYDRQYQSKKADPEYRRAAKLDEDNPDLARGGAAFAASVYDWTRAIAEFSRAAKLVGNSPASLMELASAYRGAGKPASAASAYDQIVGAEPKFAEAWLQLGIVCGQDLKEVKRAIRAFKSYQENGGKDLRVAGWIRDLEAAK